MNFDQAHRLTSPDQWFRYWMPYQFVKLKSERHKHAFLPVNRNYKPLGYTGKDYVDYQKFEAQGVVFASDPTKFKDVWSDLDGLYLYDDDPDSRKDYFERLSRLFSHSVSLADRVAAIAA